MCVLTDVCVLSILRLQMCKLVRGRCQGSHSLSLDGPNLPPRNMLTGIQRHQTSVSCFYSQIHRKKPSTKVYMHTPANLFAHKAHCTAEIGGTNTKKHESSLGMELFLISCLILCPVCVYLQAREQRPSLCMYAFMSCLFVKNNAHKAKCSKS